MLLFDRRGFSDQKRAGLEIERYERLVRDLHCMRDGIGPDELTLARAPLLERWLTVTQQVAVLFGPVIGNPGLRNPDLIATSEPIVGAQELGWIRTRSRYYRLGPSVNGTVLGSGADHVWVGG